MKRRVIIWGASGHALVVADIIRLSGEYEIAGFLDDITPGRTYDPVFNTPVFSKRECLLEQRDKGVNNVIMGFGNCEARLKLAMWSRQQGLSLATAIHPKATAAKGVTVGQGTVIVAGAVINSGAYIGENVIVNTCASVDHECKIDDGAHICPGVHLAGRVSVGRATWVGIGSTVIDRVRIGAGVMIGAGSVVVNDIPDGVLAYGVPAKIIKRL